MEKRNIKTSFRESLIRTPSGDIRFLFAVSTGWNRTFAKNVQVETTRIPQRAKMQLALGLGTVKQIEFLRTAAEINNSSRALTLIEKMRHALCDYDTLPEHIHKPVIHDMGLLATANAIRTVNLAHPEIMERLFPVLVEYDMKTLQTQRDIHKYISQQINTPTAVAS